MQCSSNWRFCQADGRVIPQRGDEEEYWSQPMGESMVGTFRVVKDGKAVFYEFWAIEVEDGKAIFKMKHFDLGLLGWESRWVP
jgi:hypothetical protein